MFWVSARGARTAAQSILENVTRLELILDPDAEGCLSEAVYVPAGRPESSQRAEVPVTSATATTLPEASVTVSSRVPKDWRGPHELESSFGAGVAGGVDSRGHGGVAARGEVGGGDAGGVVADGRA